MSEEYAIPGFSKHSLIREHDGTWTVVGASGRPMTGGARPRDNPNRRFFCLRADSGKGTVVQLGRLVLLAMVGPPPEGTECCHKNGDPGDNTPDNLYWGTDSDNFRDAMRHGTVNKAVLTPVQVEAIRSEYVARPMGGWGWGRYQGRREGSQEWLASKYGVSQATIHNVIKGTYRQSDVHVA